MRQPVKTDNTPAQGIIHNVGGFTLVETLVAAALLTIVIVSLAAMVRKGREMEITDKHRRQARLIINSLLESQTYNYANFAALTACTNTQHPLLDNRNGIPLTGTLTITVTDETEQAIAVKKIRMSLTWPQNPPYEDSITIDKWITQVP
jgi:Tfp pilus assembly protein PilV